MKIVPIVVTKHVNNELFAQIPFKGEFYAVTCCSDQLTQYPDGCRVKLLKKSVGPLRMALELEFQDSILVVNEPFVDIDKKAFWKCVYDHDPDVMLFASRNGSLQCKLNADSSPMKVASVLHQGVHVLDAMYWRKGGDFVRYGAEAINKGGRTLYAAVNRAIYDCKKVTLLT
jgi:hypothetical protein